MSDEKPCCSSLIRVNTLSERSKVITIVLKPSIIECKGLLEYLRNRTPEMLEKLYGYPATCMAVYRVLPDMAKQFVTRMLFVEQPVPQAVVSSWIAPDFAKEQTESIECLSKLKMWSTTSISGGLTGWILCPIFRKNLKIALLGGGNPWSMSYCLEIDSKPRDLKFLDQYAQQRWRCVLHYMVGISTAQGDVAISPDAVRVLLGAKLMKRGENNVITITRQGFQFLLLETQAQVWFFMCQYLDTCDNHRLSLPECQATLFQLSFSMLGKNYSSEGMSPQIKIFLQHLREFGLVYQRKRKEERFYPTRLALGITNNNVAVEATTSADGETPDSGYLLIETNFRVYAYTESPLQIAILSLFAELLYRLPNLVVSVMTRESVRQALRGGITADQIISYLKQYAHPKMIVAETAGKFKSPLPPSVVDQIKLWELERNRITFTEGVIYNQFLSETDFETLRDYANQLEALVWHNEQKRVMVVAKFAHGDVKKFWKRYTKGVAQKVAPKEQ